MSDVRFPRVLVTCDEPINRVGGGGVTMGNLFRGWPKDSLAQIWAHHRFEIDKEVCSRYLRLGSHALPGAKWAPQGLRRQRRLVQRLRGLIRPGIRLDYPKVLAWAREFGPELIYSQATPYPMYTWWLPRWLSSDLGVPLVNHIMDDWPSAVQQEWPIVYRQILMPVLRRQLRLLFGTGVCNLAICQQMADDFAVRYGTPFVPFHNMIDLENWAAPRTDYAAHPGAFRIVYLGALADDMQVHSLKGIAETISQMAGEGISISLTVYTGPMFLDCFQQHLGDITAVSHGGTIARENLCACLAAADLLVVPVNFDAHSLAMAQYSMPTKVPEYMASGTPVLVYAAAHVPPAQYAAREGWGYVVAERDAASLRQAIERLMSLEELRARLGKRGRELAIRNHDARVVRERFRELMRGAAKRSIACDSSQDARP